MWRPTLVGLGWPLLTQSFCKNRQKLSLEPIPCSSSLSTICSNSPTALLHFSRRSRKRRHPIRPSLKFTHKTNHRRAISRTFRAISQPHLAPRTAARLWRHVTPPRDSFSKGEPWIANPPAFQNRPSENSDERSRRFRKSRDAVFRVQGARRDVTRACVAFGRNEINCDSNDRFPRISARDDH